ncbi:glutamate--tRNA ligase [Ahrensia sp. R2A130]|uniref:glutamate--tRNA ligase n=1 Tax=Ahrensia sp. R2A130 TaxID=744979 RepID=UPI0001E0C99E|nr:glutamate--tRNA ligase [Ahrensia sp. R2A130]EFL90247.1 glutamyl-tRNA synthetase [Ahrensia sp. R2A130]
MTKPVITRFAPSPTGFLHIGGARTALFNWLLARSLGGKMLLRIEDTDRARSTDEAVDALLDGLTWLGLDWDGEPISQFSRADRHREVVDELLAKGEAYPCYATPEELTEMREKARAEKRPPRYDGRWRDRDPAEAPEGVKPVIRIKSPQDGETVVNDLVQGEVRFPNADLDDLVLLRSDGSPTYMLAVVVDDHDMDVSHIVRGDDHLTNAARQTIIFNAMGWNVPEMAHIPLIYGADGAKLSKRHGAIGAEAYRAMGYLPDALRNYLVRLSWSHGDEEFFTQAQLDELFSLDSVGKSPARFDFAKLENMNGHYIRAADDADLAARLQGLLPEVEGGSWFSERWNDTRHAQLVEAMPGLKERAKTLLDLLEGARFLFVERPLNMEEKAAALLGEDAQERLAMLLPDLQKIETWSVETVEDAVRVFAKANELKLGQIAQPIRAATTGKTQSPGVFDVMAVLGKEECIARLQDQAT